MAKTTAPGTATRFTTRFLQVDNGDQMIRVKVNKRWLLRSAKALLITISLVGYGSLVWSSYQMNSVFFWTLVKMGFILGIIMLLALFRKP